MREAGILVPLFALGSRRSWGIGEFGDLPAFCGWVARARHRRIQLLPLAEMPLGERSPYSAISAFALDPIYLTLADVEDFVEAGGERALDGVTRDRLAALRSGADIDYDGIRAVKLSALRIAFARFLAAERGGGSRRARAFADFRATQAGWLDGYSAFWEREERGGGGAGEVRLWRCYLQWLTNEQWARAHDAARAVGVAVDGDLPFLVGADSADVRARPAEFRLDASAGAPPDAFNEDGQDWRLPPCRWDIMAAGNFSWLRARMRRMADLFDGCRVDHVVGYFRVWVRVDGAAPSFVPTQERDQEALGSQLLRVMQEEAPRLRLVAEDLGVVPDFVRTAIARLDIPGYRVLRWEQEGQAYRDPTRFPALSVATTGTHDTSSLATWWTSDLDEAERRALAAVPAFGDLAGADARFTPMVRDALLAGLYAAGSSMVLLPLQDAYGGTERVNTPATVGPANWNYRAPWHTEDLDGESAAACARRLCGLVRASARG